MQNLTIKDEMALRTPIIDHLGNGEVQSALWNLNPPEGRMVKCSKSHTTGNVRGGGIHVGLLFSFMAAFSPLTSCPLASNGENTRLLIET